MTEINEKSTKEFWTNAFENAPKTLQKNDPIKNWIDSVLDFAEIRTCLEIGCYPGKYLTIFGDKKIEINGLDYIDDVVNLKEYYSQIYNVGEFINADVLIYEPKRQYDCVMSFGLIEHFMNWEEVITKHIKYVNDGGYLILEVPNFRGWLQRIPRYLFDRSNFNIHNLASMDVDSWEKLFSDNNFTVVDKRYFGGYQLWYENSEIRWSSKVARSKLEKILRRIKGILYPNLENSKEFSAYMGIIVKKND